MPHHWIRISTGTPVRLTGQRQEPDGVRARAEEDRHRSAAVRPSNVFFDGDARAAYVLVDGNYTGFDLGCLDRELADPKTFRVDLLTADEKIELEESGRSTTPGRRRGDVTAAATRGLPTGTVTLLFTDVEGSTDLLRTARARIRRRARAPSRVLREAVDEHGGAEVDTQGDAFFFAFPTAAGAVRAAADGAARARRAVVAGRRARPRPHGSAHGRARAARDRIRRPRRPHAARIARPWARRADRRLALDARPPRRRTPSLVDLGDHRLKDIDVPIRLFQLSDDGLATEFPPLRSLHASNLPRPATRLVDRVRGAAALQSLARRGAA